MPKRAFRIGQRFVLSEEALENYGQRYRGMVFHVEQWFDHYCNVWAIEQDPHGHPGYDGLCGECLYEARENACPGALYEWEMEPAPARKEAH